jgi:hypothetical protein
MLERLKHTASLVLASFRIGIGQYRNHLILRDGTASVRGILSKKGEWQLGERGIFGLKIPAGRADDFPEFTDFIAIPNAMNTSAKVYMLVEVCDIEMTDESLRLQ